MCNLCSVWRSYTCCKYTKLFRTCNKKGNKKSLWRDKVGFAANWAEDPSKSRLSRTIYEQDTYQMPGISGAGVLNLT